MRVVYFAWLRERVGLAHEDVEFPSHVITVTDAMTHLATLDDLHAHAFAEPATIRAALDKHVAEPDALLNDAREIAFFPPMTGG